MSDGSEFDPQTSCASDTGMCRLAKFDEDGSFRKSHCGEVCLASVTLLAATFADEIITNVEQGLEENHG